MRDAVMIRAVVLDIGSVLEIIDDTVFPAPFEHRHGLPAGAVHEARRDLPGDAGVGELSEAQVRRALAAAPRAERRAGRRADGRLLALVRRHARPGALRLVRRQRPLARPASSPTPGRVRARPSGAGASRRSPTTSSIRTRSACASRTRGSTCWRRSGSASGRTRSSSSTTSRATSRRRRSRVPRRRAPFDARVDPRGRGDHRGRPAPMNELPEGPLRLGPLLRYVDCDSATIWVETRRRPRSSSRPATVTARARTFAAHGHHYALVEVTGSARRARRRRTRARRRRPGLAADDPDSPSSRRR